MNAQSTLVRSSLALVSTFALAGGLASAPIVVASDTVADEAVCQVSLEPSTVKAGEESIEVAAMPSAPIGSLVSADIDGESAVGVEVVQAERGERGDYALSLNVLSASAGTWNLTLHGVHGDCTGTLHVETGVASN